MSELANRHARLYELFVSARDLDGADRDRFLRDACGTDDELREEIISLLEIGPNVPTLLRTGAALAADPSLAEPTPRRIGPYSIVRKLGAGGMGVVFLAEQERPLRRQVALKWIRPGAENAQVLARFEAERATLSRMQHPNIAQVLDAGSTRNGRPYFVLEYVPGTPITNYCNDHGLDLRARLRLFLSVCRGVQHAHQKAIIHRDIKPSNILVTGAPHGPVPKIIDFGIAKALDAEGAETACLTSDGQFIGTPEYMSPEVARGAAAGVDVRTDVYSLGVVLYELIAGSRPIRPDNGRSTADEARRAVLEQEPERPSARVQNLNQAEAKEVASRCSSEPRVLGRQLRGDLDSIVMKAIEKEPERRYGSVADLAEDLERHLHGFPVLAGPPSRIYRWRKLARRHRIRVVAGAALLTLLVAAGIVGWQQTQVVSERRRAEAASETAERTASFLALLAPARDHLSDLGRAAESVNDPAMNDMLESFRAERDAWTSILEFAADGLRQSLGDDDPRTLQVVERLGNRYMMRFKLEQAERTARELAERARRVLGADDPLTLRAHALLGRVYTRQRRLEEAEPLIRNSLQELTRSLGPDHPDTLVTTFYLGSWYTWGDRWAEAEALHFASLPVLVRVLGELDGRTLATKYNLAAAAALKGDRVCAIAYLRDVVEGGFLFAAPTEDGAPLGAGAGMLSDPPLRSLHGDPRFEAMLRDGGYMAHVEDAVLRSSSAHHDLAGAKQSLKRAVELGLVHLDWQFEIRRPLRRLLPDPEIQSMITGGVPPPAPDCRP